MSPSLRGTGRQYWVALRSMILLTVVLGIAYPLVMTGIGQLTMPGQSNGSMVTYQGKPIELGNIKFEPTDKNLQPDGGEIKEGVYHVKLPIGSALVSISGAKKVGEKKSTKTGGPGQAKYEEFVPKKYSRQPEIVADVKADTTKLDFDLK